MRERPDCALQTSWRPPRELGGLWQVRTGVVARVRERDICQPRSMPSTARRGAGGSKTSCRRWRPKRGCRLPSGSGAGGSGPLPLRQVATLHHESRHPGGGRRNPTGFPRRRHVADAPALCAEVIGRRTSGSRPVFVTASWNGRTRICDRPGGHPLPADLAEWVVKDPPKAPASVAAPSSRLVGSPSLLPSREQVLEALVVLGLSVALVDEIRVALLASRPAVKLAALGRSGRCLIEHAHRVA
jgi:hypothetical protein